MFFSINILKLKHWVYASLRKAFWLCVYLLSGFNTLVGKVWEGRAGNKAAHAGGDVQVPIFKNDFPLANYH